MLFPPDDDDLLDDPPLDLDELDTNNQAHPEPLNLCPGTRQNDICFCPSIDNIHLQRMDGTRYAVQLCICCAGIPRP